MTHVARLALFHEVISSSFFQATTTTPRSSESLLSEIRGLSYAMELVPKSQAGSSFAQQGTIDWTALSHTSFSASLSVLGRLSSAGLESLTVAMAQAVRMNIPIGLCGERKLNEAMASLKAFSSFGDVFWFGVGVRHILRMLVQSSQGASSVALAACLAESHSAQYSAKVFYEMAKLIRSPSELTPSFSQWETYVRVCAGIFANSIFGYKYAQIAQLGGFNTPVHILDSANNRCPKPEELAQLIFEIGKIQMGHVESIEVIGGPGCCWPVAFCDYLLGLRVQLRLKSGDIAFQNFDSANHQAQIRF